MHRIWRVKRYNVGTFRSLRWLSTAQRAPKVSIEPPKVASSAPKLESKLESKLVSPSLPDWDRGGKTNNDTLTPLYASINKIIDANKGCVCLVQVGSFYEIYFDQAQEYGPKLGIKVASRKTNNCIIPMAGFPTYQLQKFVKMLIQDYNVNVAIIDQYPMEKRTMDAIIHRKVSRIVTPGTLVDETFLNYNQNNYLAAIHLPPGCTKTIADPAMEVGLSWVDVSVGEFYVQRTTLEDVVSDIFRINPSEIIIPKEFQDLGLLTGNWYTPLSELRRYFLRYHQTVYKDLKLQFTSSYQATRKAIELLSVREEAAMNMILSYINVNIPEANPALDIPTQYWNEKYVRMDPRTREALELTERSTAGRRSVVGTLVSTIRKTVTPSGTRMLSQWINSPILDIETLNYRYDFVEAFRADIVLTQGLRANLSKVGDFIRSVQRLSFGTGDSVSHLAAIADGLYKLDRVEELLKQQKRSKLWDEFLHKFSVPITVAEKIDETLNLSELINDNSTLEEREDNKKPRVGAKFFVRPSFNSELALLHSELQTLLTEEDKLLEQITAQITDIDSKLAISKRDSHGRFSNVIHVSGKTKLIEAVGNLLAKDVREKRKSTIIIKPYEWSMLQALVNSKVEEILEVEQKVISSLRTQVLASALPMRVASQLVDFLDVTSSFGLLAHETELVRPKVVSQPKLEIIDGRHLVVESALKSLGEMFVPNTSQLNSNGTMWMITGPNMGGKSTFLRQNALIVIMAQIGCFVPAKRATIGVVDRIFTRIGASDDLFNDLSTFMVEMIETSNILKNASQQSLAIVDEIGRGTSGKEGLAVAYAAMIHLLQVNKCRTLFATHFGRELVALLEEEGVDTRKLHNYRTSVVKNDSQIIMNHRLEPGITERSYALEVARMSNFPDHAMQTASRVLDMLTTREWKVNEHHRD